MGKRIPIFLGFILLAIAIWLQTTTTESVQHLIERLENIAYDMQLRANFFAAKKLANSSVVIVDVDDKSLAKQGRWPWPREKVAELIHRLQEEGAVVIALDVLFSEKEENIADKVLQQLNKDNLADPTSTALINKIKPQFDGDMHLAESMAKSDVVLGVSFTPEPSLAGTLGTPAIHLTTPAEKQLGLIDMPGIISYIPTLQAAAKSTGFINVFPDSDGIIRRVPVLLRYQDNLYPSLALEAVRLYLLSSISLITASYENQLRLEGVKVGDHIIPTDEKGQVIVPFKGKSFTFPYFSATDVLTKQLPPNALAGKIVFIGTSATGLGDLKATAIQNVYPGVEVQASIAQGILDNHFSYQPSWSLGAEIFFTVVFGLLCIFIFPFLGPRILGLLIISLPILFLFANSYLWEKTGLIISFFVPIALILALAMLNMVYGYLFETRRRERLKEMFGQYVPEKHIDEMLKSTGNYGLYGEDREMTVLFADIRNFTTISENMTASQLKEMLNQFFTPMTEIIFKHRGTIDKYVGDLIMAFWGAPLKDKRHAEHAIQTALDMQHAIHAIKSDFSARGLPDINIGIGINTGLMSVGDMGSRFRRNYTVLGDAVNLASRVEGLTKFYGVKIIVTEYTAHQQKHFVFRQLDRVKVKGKDHGVVIYDVICHRQKAGEELIKEVETYHAALSQYFNQQWDEAEKQFALLHQQYPHTKLYLLYLHRVQEFKQTPPPSPWDGIFVHAAK